MWSINSKKWLIGLLRNSQCLRISEIGLGEIDMMEESLVQNVILRTLEALNSIFQGWQQGRVLWYASEDCFEWGNGWTVARADSLCLLGVRCLTIGAIPRSQLYADKWQVSLPIRKSCSQWCNARHVRNSLKFLLQTSHWQKDHLQLLLESIQW